jgi:hypothetical protein
VRRSVLSLAALLAALALLLPLAALADSCTDCLWASSPECCPPSCCSCCVQGLSALTVAAWEGFSLSQAGLAMDPAEGGGLSMSPRGVFHVPKASA